MHKKIIIRVTTLPISLEKLLSGQLRYMNSFYKVIGVSSDRENLQKLTEKEGIAVFPIEMTRKITPFQDLKAVWEMYRYFKHTKPFIVHSHTPKAGIIAMLAAKLAGVPHRLHTVAGLPLLEATGIKRKILNRVEQLTYRFATKIYPNSFVLRDIIESQNLCPPIKLQVLANGSSNGIDTAHFSRNHFPEAKNTALRSQLGIAESDFVFVFVGRLVADKGINELLSAFDRLSALRPNIKLLLVGNFEDELDPLSSKTMQIIRANNKIKLTGYQNDVRPYFAISDALVFPSYREGFPNVVMQAGAMGLPSIVTDINGCNEIIIDGKNGVIIPVKDESAIFDAMDKILSDSTYNAYLQSNSRELIVSRYEQQLVWDAILNEYQKLDCDV